MGLTFIEYKTMRFYISQTPTEENMGFFLDFFEKSNIRHVIRLCGKTYDSRPIENENIQFYDLEITDGEIPNLNQIEQWNNIIYSIPPYENILVHCVAGLGRAPLMVAISLINEKMDPYQAIELIRLKRKGSINSKQLTFLVSYQPKKSSKFSLFSFLICK